MNVQLWHTYLTNLRRLPFVVEAEIEEQEPNGPRAQPDSVLRLRTPTKTHRLAVELRRTHLTYVLVEGLLARRRGLRDIPWILFAPHTGRKMAAFLAARGVNFVDQAGNCRLFLGNDHVAIIEGRPPAPRTARARGLGAPGHQVLFAILANPDLLNVPIRNLATVAGVGKTAAANTLRRLEEEGLVARGARRRQFLNRDLVLERWIAGYANLVRPRLTIGQFQTPYPDPGILEKTLQKVLKHRVDWAWGGGAAAERLDRYYRGPETVLHLAERDDELPALIEAIPDPNGTLTIMLAPGEMALRGPLPNTAHPLLVYTELVITCNERALEAAERIRNQYLWKT
jgi:hypothetical protein